MSNADQGNETVPLPEAEREALIDELSQGSDFSHGVFGCFDKLGHYLKDIKGVSKLPKTVLQYERAYEYTFAKDYHQSSQEFRARVLGAKTNQGGVFVMVFNDRQGDKRGASHTDYALVIPKVKLERIYPAIEADPSILVDVFKKVYPSYDRSDGSLIIDPEHAKITPMPKIVLE